MAETTANFLGKCKEKGCDYVIFATGADVQQAEKFNEVRAGAGVFKVGNNGRFARCINGHKFFAVKLVKGTYSPDHKCDSRCLNAKGWSCTCSCGGANHGRGHVATIVKAAELTPAQVVRETGGSRSQIERAEPQNFFLGEVGQTIRGVVRVVRVSDVSNGARLYTFETRAGLFIKWFAPSYADPQWESSAEYSHTIRAKVKKHDDFGGLKSTVVTYVEEVE